MRLQGDTPIETGSLRYPLLVKPSDSFSGRGVTKVFDRTELAAAVADARRNSRSAEVVIEEFIEGSLHSHSAFIKDQEIAFDVFVDEYSHGLSVPGQFIEPSLTPFRNRSLEDASHHGARRQAAKTARTA